MTGAPPGAILLAGGRATRVGGVAKPLFEVRGSTLLALAVKAATDASCRPIVVVGRRHDLDPLGAFGVDWAQEDPPFGGPVAGVIAALDTWGAAAPEWTLVLACDLPEVGRALARLRRDAILLAAESDGVCLSDATSRPQWLTGLYRTASLRRAAGGLAERGRNAAVRALVRDLAITVVADTTGAADDVDTWEDLERARERAREERSTVAEASRTLPPEALDAWAATLRDHFGLGADDVPVSLILDLARDVANGVARPAAPFSAFVAGLVAGRAGGSPDDIAAAVSAVAALARDWQA